MVPWPYVLMGEGVGIPLVLAIVAFPVVRAGPGKDRLIRVAPPDLVRHCPGSGGSPLFGPSPLWGSGRTRASMVFAVVDAVLAHLDPGLRIESTLMKLVIHPAVEPERLEALLAAAPGAEWVNAPTEAEAEAAMPGADGFLGKITPAMLARADRLRWVQAFTVSLEHYMFPELAAHPCVLTNMRGLFGDVIADQVMGYVLCFARNLHTYIRQQVEHRYEPVGGEAARVSNAAGPGRSARWTEPRSTCPRPPWASSAWGRSAARSRAGRWRSGWPSGAWIGFPTGCKPPEGVERVDGIDRLARAAGLERFRRDRRTAHARDGAAVRRRGPVAARVTTAT